MDTPNNNAPLGNRDGVQGVPPPPPPRITVRTMDSDTKSMIESGGNQPMGEIINIPRPGEPKPELPKPPEEVKINVPGYSGPEEKLFSPETLPSAPEVEVIGEKKNYSTWIIVSIIAVAAVGFGLVGYYFIYPLFLPKEEAPVVNNGTESAATTTPSDTFTHSSFINSDKVETATSTAAAQNENLASATSTLLKEVKIEASGKPVVFAKHFSSIISQFSETDLAEVFEKDFTAFVYYDRNGGWPGYVAKIKSGDTPAAAQARALAVFNRIEGFPGSSLAKLFLRDPGAPSQAGFKNGQASSTATRYLTFSLAGAAINYGWFNNYLILTTSYPSILEASKRLSVDTTK